MWQRVLSVSAAVIIIVLAYRELPPDPDIWRWSLFGAGLGLAGAVVGAAVAFAVMAHRRRTDALRHVHN
jgi:uncharacterized BrkB/YihY/UPF0761 family membrane protein